MTTAPYDAHQKIGNVPTLARMVALFGAFYGVLLVASYPLATTLVIASTTITYLTIRRHLRKINESNTDARSLSIPGIGTIKY